MEAKNKANNNRIVTILCVTAAVALVVGLGYLGVQNVSVVEKLSAPLRNLAQNTCVARHGQQLFTDLIKGNKAPARVRILHQKEHADLTTDQVGVPPLEQLLDKMTLDDMIGQILQPENGNAKCYAVSDNKVGSVFFGGNDSPGDDDAKSWHKRANEIQAEAHRTAPHHIPVFVGVDTIHGMSHMKGATIFPHNIALGCTRNPKLLEQIGYITATESNAVDVNWAEEGAQEEDWHPATISGRDTEGNLKIVWEVDASLRGRITWEDICSPSSVRPRGIA